MDEGIAQGAKTRSQVPRELLIAEPRAGLESAMIGPRVVFIQAVEVFEVHTDSSPSECGVRASHEQKHVKCADALAVVRATRPANGRILRRMENRRRAHRCNTLPRREKSRRRDSHIAARTSVCDR